MRMWPGPGSSFLTSVALDRDPGLLQDAPPGSATGLVGAPTCWSGIYSRSVRRVAPGCLAREGILVANVARPGEVSEMLRSGREKSGLSCRALAPSIRKADGVSISPSYISDIEAGRSVPRDDIARQLAETLGMPTRKFLEACARDRKRL